LITVAFLGAAGTVTGSKYLVTVNEQRVLVDCGMFQGAKALRQRNWEPLPFTPGEIDAVILTHCHIDHVGYLPRMVKAGFEGPVYCTPPTVELSSIALLDTAHLQMEDAEYRNKKKLSSHPVALPLFTDVDAEAAIRLLRSVEYDNWFEVAPGIRFRFHDAGHLLGAAGVELILNDGTKERTIYFSGDVGRYGNPLTTNPSQPPETDYLVCESTYGGKMHPPEDPAFEIMNLVKETFERKTVLLIPAFAVGRTQQLIYLINDLARNNLVPTIEIHVDSPMAIEATDIYSKYKSYHVIPSRNLEGANNMLKGPNVFFHKDKNSSQTLNRLRGPAVIISASGMLAGGRILHHLLNRLIDPNVIVALVGFMAEGTLGRKLLDGEKEIYIHKTLVPVRSKMVTIQSLSGHADYYEILHWLEGYKMKPRKVFVTHGEITQSEGMAKHLKEEKGWDCVIPSLDNVFSLE